LSAESLGVLVVDHGSRRAASNEQLKVLAGRVAGMLPQAIVRHAHMELATPTIGDAVDALAGEGCRELVVLLCFFAEGRHASEDVPALVEEAAARHPGLQWRIGEPLGPHEDLARLLLERGGLEPESRA
jgi:sirohydrochlorin ferrochelatase